MRVLTLMICAFAFAACTPRSSGLGLVDLSRATSGAIKEFHGWVDKDDREGQFPAGLCLAAVLMEASLADTSTTNAGVTIPLAAPAQGLSGALGYTFTEIEDGADTIVIPIYANHLAEPKYKGLPKDGKKRAAAIAKLRAKDIKPFVSGFDELSKTRPQGVGELSVPYGVSEDEFKNRQDLAAELWRIREGIHDLVVNSPPNVLLNPGTLEFIREYRLIRRGDFDVEISLGGKAAGNFGLSEGITAYNRLAIFYVPNRSADISQCDSTSLEGVDRSTFAFRMKSTLPEVR